MLLDDVLIKEIVVFGGVVFEIGPPRTQPNAVVFAKRDPIGHIGVSMQYILGPKSRPISRSMGRF